MEQAFAEPTADTMPEPVPATAPLPAPEVAGAAARPATDAFSLDQIFGVAAPAAPAPAPAPSPPPASLGTSFDEFFGAAPAPQESVRPRTSGAPRQSEDDLSAFTAWLHGLKR
jgi:hypothetical protein